MEAKIAPVVTMKNTLQEIHLAMNAAPTQNPRYHKPLWQLILEELPILKDPHTKFKVQKTTIVELEDGSSFLVKDTETIYRYQLGKCSEWDGTPGVTPEQIANRLGKKGYKVSVNKINNILRYIRHFPTKPMEKYKQETKTIVARYYDDGFICRWHLEKNTP